jgi:hypothetical protein
MIYICYYMPITTCTITNLFTDRIFSLPDAMIAMLKVWFSNVKINQIRIISGTNTTLFFYSVFFNFF